MSELCYWVHEQLNQLPLIKFPFRLEKLPKNGIYFFYEQGENWGHGENQPRIVRVGTHRSGNFRNRIAEHYLFNERKMNFDETKSKPSDRSIFRKNIGRALLNKRNDDYLQVWNIDFMKSDNKLKFKHLRKIKKEKDTESEITRILRKNFSFRFIEIASQTERMGKGGLESSIIGTLAHCSLCKPSKNWLGNSSPITKIKVSGLWLIQHLKEQGINEKDKKKILAGIEKTKNNLN